MDYTNDLNKVKTWLENHGSVTNWTIPAKVEKQLADLSKSCMAAYTPIPGDRECVGWFPFGSLANADGSPLGEKGAADGICYVIDGSDTCDIGIQENILMNANANYLASLALHEIAHLRYAMHDDDFASYHLTLLYNYYPGASD